MILIVDDYDGLYGHFWRRLGEITHDSALLFNEPDQIKLVCFTGGADVSPELYGHQNLGSHCSKARDEKELLIFEMALKHKIPMTGICRGSQFLNVMCGGTMVQHLEKSHGGNLHACQTSEGEEFRVTSSHHQMSVLGPEGLYLAWSKQPISIRDCAYDGDLSQRVLPEFEAPGLQPGYFRVTEAFVYPKQRIFAVQHHPEWQNIEEEAPQWTLKKIREFCWGEGTQTLEMS